MKSPAIIFNLNGLYYDAIMQTTPDWIIMQNADDFDLAMYDWLFMNLGI